MSVRRVRRGAVSVAGGAVGVGGGAGLGLGLAGCGGASPAAAVPYREILLDGRPVVCAEVFRTTAEHERGLSGDPAPAAGAFVNQPPLQPSLWMHNVQRNLVGVWVAAGGHILGSVQMQAMTTVLHPAPAAVPLILELSPGLWARWSGARTASLGRGGCVA